MNRWTGGDIADKSLLLWSDQGLGDSIMMARYLPLAQAKRKVVYVDSTLLRLFGKSFPDCEVLMKGWAFPRTDLHVPFMGLMRAFGTHWGNIPGGRYLWPDLATLGDKINASYGVNLLRNPPLSRAVGINWQGNKRFVRDFTRSMPLSMFEPLFAEGGTFLSLQKGAAQKDLDTYPNVIDAMDHCQDLHDTASLIDYLDLVITTDTVIPHIAGALGKPCWLLECFESEWRWGLDEKTPWYESVRIFRQTSPGDWAGVMTRVLEAYRALV